MGFIKRLFGGEEPPVLEAAVTPPAPPAPRQVAQLGVGTNVAAVALGEPAAGSEEARTLRNVMRIKRLVAARESLQRRIAEGGEHTQARRVKLASIEVELARRSAGLKAMKEAIKDLGI